MVTEWKDTVPGPRDLPWTHKAQSLVKPSLRSSQRAAEKRQAQDRPRAQREHSAGSRGEKCLLFKPQAKPFVEADERPLKGNWRLHCDTWMCSALISWAGRPHCLPSTWEGRADRGGEREAAAARLSNLATKCALWGGGQPPSGVEGSPPPGEEQLAPRKDCRWIWRSSASGRRRRPCLEFVPSLVSLVIH